MDHRWQVRLAPCIRLLAQGLKSVGTVLRDAEVIVASLSPPALMNVLHHRLLTFVKAALSLPLIHKCRIIVRTLLPLLLLSVQVEVVGDVDHQAGEEGVDGVEQSRCHDEYELEGMVVRVDIAQPEEGASRAIA